MVGPELDTDLSFWIVAGCEELMKLEEGIPISQYEQWIAKNGHDRPAMEFNLLQKFTQHKDHVLNLFVDSDVNFVRLNRYRDILPYNHNRVLLSTPPLKFYNNSSGGSDVSQQIKLYVNASWINSPVRVSGKRAFIAA